MHKDIHKWEAAGGRPPFVEAAEGRLHKGMGVWRLGRQGENPTVVIWIPTVI